MVGELDLFSLRISGPRCRLDHCFHFAEVFQRASGRFKNKLCPRPLAMLSPTGADRYVQYVESRRRRPILFSQSRNLEGGFK